MRLAPPSGRFVLDVCVCIFYFIFVYKSILKTRFEKQFTYESSCCFCFCFFNAHLLTTQFDRREVTQCG